MEKYNILVTGGSGFIGTNIVENFLNKGHKVLNLDFNKPRNAEQAKYWVKTDITDYQELQDNILSFAPDYIIHLAARTDLKGKTLEDYNANVKGVENLMSIVKKVSSLKKVIIASSMLVCHTGYYPKDQSDYAPTTVYGESKVETEKMVWKDMPNCDWCIIRPTSIWGPWFDVPYKNFFDLVVAKRYFHIGNKACTKTYGYIGNAVYQIEKLLFSPTTDASQKVYYIGDNPPINIEEWGNEIANELNYKIIKLPYFVIKMAALFGDMLKLFGIHFPMTFFRLRNMTTDNIMDLSNTYNIAPNPPYSRIEGIKNTLSWMKVKI